VHKSLFTKRLVISSSSWKTLLMVRQQK